VIASERASFARPSTFFVHAFGASKRPVPPPVEVLVLVDVLVLLDVLVLVLVLVDVVVEAPPAPPAVAEPPAPGAPPAPPCAPPAPAVVVPVAPVVVPVAPDVVAPPVVDGLVVAPAAAPFASPSGELLEHATSAPRAVATAIGSVVVIRMGVPYGADPRVATSVSGASRRSAEPLNSHAISADDDGEQASQLPPAERVA
jgi:hypothetical protein